MAGEGDGGFALLATQSVGDLVAEKLSGGVIKGVH